MSEKGLETKTQKPLKVSAETPNRKNGSVNLPRPTTKNPVKVLPTEVHSTLAKHMLVDGFDLVVDLKRSQGARVYDSRYNKKYLDFFAAHTHALVPAAPLIPAGDPTTLFTSSGMQQLVPYLKGEPHPMGKRLVISQPNISNIQG